MQILHKTASNWAYQPTSTQLARRKQRQLLPTFYVLAGLLLGYEFFVAQPESPWLTLASCSITIAALLPSFLWCSGIALGLPIFPLFALPFLWSHAWPLLVADISTIQTAYDISSYSIQSRLVAGLTTAGYLLLATLVWLKFVRAESEQPRCYKTLSPRKGDEFFLTSLFYSALYTLASSSGWLSILPSQYVGVLGSLANALVSVSSFVLSYRLGAYELSDRKARLFIVAMTIFMLGSASGLLLISIATVFAISVAAFTIGRKRVPILLICIMFFLLTFLHAGKAEVRQRYWYGDLNPNIQPWNYPSLYADWVKASWKASTTAKDNADEEGQSFSERASLIQMLLIAQNNSPEPKPFLAGVNYTIILQMLIPRVIYPDRIATNSGGRLLSLHYQLLAEDSHTSIAWGQLAEAYANFGYSGCVVLSIFLGYFYGWITRWSMSAPILSYRALLSVAIAAYALQIEIVLGTLIAAWSQLAMVITGIAFVFMRNHKIDDNNEPLINPE